MNEKSFHENDLGNKIVKPFSLLMKYTSNIKLIEEDDKRYLV